MTATFTAMQGYAVLDIETTGLSRKRDRVIEIAVALYDAQGTAQGRFHTLVNPGTPIPESASRVNGITSAMLRNAPDFGSIAQSLLEMFRDRVVVGHNVEAFDRHFIAAELLRAGVEWEQPPTLDTLRIARQVVPGQTTYKLRSLCGLLSITNTQEHRALGDALATWELLSQLSELADPRAAMGELGKWVRPAGNYSKPQRPPRALPRQNKKPAPARLSLENGDSTYDIDLAENLESSAEVVSRDRDAFWWEDWSPVSAREGGHQRWAGRGWEITVTRDCYHIRGPKQDITITHDSEEPLYMRRRWFRWALFQGRRHVATLSGLKGPEAARVVLGSGILAAREWCDAYQRLLEMAGRDGIWITTEMLGRLESARTEVAALDMRITRGVYPELSQEDERVMRLVAEPAGKAVEEQNNLILRDQLASQKDLLDTIETLPLSDEQQRAALTFDNRVQVVAAAGSGKTSVMVARAAYAVSRGLMRPDEILMLAYNKAAAEELRTRVAARFAAAGLNAAGIKIATFHSFGLDVIGEAVGEKPRLPAWLAGQGDLQMMRNIVDDLCRQSTQFRKDWETYRLIYADIPREITGGNPNHYDKEKDEKWFNTFSGAIVRSHGERLIANWLYLNDVQFEYERPYQVNIGTIDRGRYRPDFYYPEADVWHEHWALDAAGNPPESFRGYAADMVWKKKTHQQNNTKLIETTWYDVVYGDGLDKLAGQLKEHGIQTKWNPERAILGGRAVEHEHLHRLMRSFMIHVKSNKQTPETIAERLLNTHQHLSSSRGQMFLRLYWPIHREWQSRLEQQGAIDFEDMLTHAADYLEDGTYRSTYALVLVDEMQDASQARARMVRGLVREPGRFLLAVGDDWQSINRFAGADMEVMTNFTNWFGPGPQLRLSTTFRCTQAICDASSGFILKNANQIHKQVNSAHAERGHPVTMIHTHDPAGALRQCLLHLSEAVKAGKVPGGAKQLVSVYVLGRYNRDKDLMPAALPSNLDVTFKTVHSAKGLEADYVILPNLTTGTYGFPSSIEDDPVLDLAMPKPDTHAHAEERRLFYVALTRARRQAVLITRPGAESPFVEELIDDNVLELASRSTPLEGARSEKCPACGKGVLETRTGKYGEFKGCSRFPVCKVKSNSVDRRLRTRERSNRVVYGSRRRVR